MDSFNFRSVWISRSSRAYISIGPFDSNKIGGGRGDDLQFPRLVRLPDMMARRKNVETKCRHVSSRQKAIQIVREPTQGEGGEDRGVKSNRRMETMWIHVHKSIIWSEEILRNFSCSLLLRVDVSIFFCTPCDGLDTSKKICLANVLLNNAQSVWLRSKKQKKNAIRDQGGPINFSKLSKWSEANLLYKCEAFN